PPMAPLASVGASRRRGSSRASTPSRLQPHSRPRLPDQGGTPGARHLRTRPRQHGARPRPNPPTNAPLRAPRASAPPRHPERAIQRDRRPRRAPPGNRSTRIPEQQLGDPCATRARIPEPRLPATQAAIHGGQSDPLQRRRTPLPCPRPHPADAGISCRMTPARLSPESRNLVGRESERHAALLLFARPDPPERLRPCRPAALVELGPVQSTNATNAEE